MEKQDYQPTLNQLINDFNQRLSLNVISDKDLTLLPDEAYVRFKTEKQVLLKQMVEELEMLMKMSVLYLIHDEEEDRQAAVLYSKPCGNRMYIIKISSTQMGLTRYMSCFMFLSMDDMYRKIIRERDSLNIIPSCIVRPVDNVKIYKTFF